MFAAFPQTRDRLLMLIEPSAPAVQGTMPELPASIDGYLVVDCIDVGQGDCTLIRQGDQVMLFDCGGEIPMKIRSYLRSQGIDHIDSVWLSHGDSDHIMSFPSVSYAYEIGTVFLNSEEKTTSTWSRVTDRIREAGIYTVRPKAGDVFPLGDATVTVLGPVRSDQKSSNNNSLAIKLTYGDTSFLLCGDAEEEEEHDILLSGASISCDVLHVNHHGSNSSSSASFLAAADPDYAVISCGADNDYGHPNKKALVRLTLAGAKILRTDESGTVRFLSDGNTVTAGTQRSPENE